MKRLKMIGMRWLLGLAALSLLLSGCATGNSVSTSQAPAPGSIELLLVKAGFETVADTHPKCAKFCQQLPSGQLIPYKKGGKLVYGYLSPETKRLYVGNEADYQRFINLAVLQKIEEQHRPVLDPKDDPEFLLMWADSQGAG